MEQYKKITFHHLLWYFVIFSVIGLIVETLYGAITNNVLESRKGFIWGPLCPVYGAGAVILIICLNRIDNKHYLKLFLAGFLLGSIIEYGLSYILEAIYSIRFWEYSYTNLDINGRICVPYSFFWGILAILLMRFIRPFIDKIIDKINPKIKKILDISIFIFLIIDCLITIWAVTTYKNRAEKIYYNNVHNISTPTNNILINIKNSIENNYFTNERMKKIFPNLRFKDSQGNEIWLKDIV